LLHFTAAIFLSAFLLFAIQPMFAKMVLPQLGGAPSVWSVAMVFFQGLLLLGYLYAHFLSKYLPLRAALLVHLAVTALAFISLPVAIAAGLGKPPVEGQVIWLLKLFTVSIGLPFFALSANGPLLQAWFSRTGHVQARDPYFLYSGSNIGSLLALLAYPLVIEPQLMLSEQSRYWTAAFGIFLGLLALLAIVMVSQGVKEKTGAQETFKASARRRFYWTALAFIPSALLISVTAHISTDVAAVPFLWILPLVIYLLTFIIVFARKPLVTPALAASLLPLVVAPMLLVLIGGFFLPWPITLFLNLAGFFIIGLRCHGLLAEDRPQPAGLTEFYFFLSLGGVLGGLFSGLAAPYLFNSVIEYPLLVALSLLTLPNLKRDLAAGWQRDAIVAAIAIAIAGASGFFLKANFNEKLMWTAVLTILGAVMIADRRRPLRVLLVAVGALLLWPALKFEHGHGLSKRSFFGVHKVHESMDGKYRILEHGTTIHGAQALDPAKAREPLTYYAKENNFGQVVRAIRARHALKSIGAVGLGTGSMACHLEKGESITFFEIDPVVVSIANSEFSFLKNCAPEAHMVVGDARLTLAEQADGSFDLLIIDAFTSDAVPLHLLTVEALQLYMSKLKPDGVVLLHISNRNLEMESMLASSAAGLNLAAYARTEAPDVEKWKRMVAPSQVVVMARKAADLGDLPKQPGWRMLTRTHVLAWRDDFSNILGALWRRLNEDRFALADQGQVAAPQ
jgi:predicted O-methyltransferase YrrM